MKTVIWLLILPLFCGLNTAEEDWTTIYILGNGFSSSELDAVDPFEEGQGPYGVHNLGDNNMATAWVEGVKGYGEGEYLYIGLGDELPSAMRIANGYQKSESLFLKNSRVKRARVIIFAGFHIDGDVTEIASVYRLKKVGEAEIITLKDEMGMQEITLPLANDEALDAAISLAEEFSADFSERIIKVKEFNPGCLHPVTFSYFLKLEIIETYPGSSWDDTCISELNKGNIKRSPLNERERVVRLFDTDDQGKILFDTEMRRGLLLVDLKQLKEYEEAGDGVEMWITLMDVSPDKEWAQVDYMFSSEGNRTEEYSVLYNVRRCLSVNEDILAVRYGMYGFTEQDGKIWLDTADGLIDLLEIKKQLDAKY